MSNKIRKWFALLMSALMLLSSVPAVAQQINIPINPGDWSIVVEHAHRWGNWQTIKEASCTQSGTQERTCTSCGQTDTQKIGAYGHKWGYTTVLRASTCAVRGEGEHTCSRCNKKETFDLKLAAHQWGEWYVMLAATPFSKGIEERKCGVCDETEQREFYPEGTLKRGDNGDDVKALQEMLNEAGYDCGRPDGNFGPKTEQTIKAAQEALGMEIDGIGWQGLQEKLSHDWSEWRVITEATSHSKGIEERQCQKSDCGKIEQREFYPEGTLMRGDEGDAVKALQEALNKQGYNVGRPDGKFGAKTEDVIKAIQKNQGMEQDGIAWPEVLSVVMPDTVEYVPDAKSTTEDYSSVKETLDTAEYVSVAKTIESYSSGKKVSTTSAADEVTYVSIPEPVEPDFVVEKHVMSTPANGMFYVPGEVVSYGIGIKNRGSKLTDGVLEDVLASAPLATGITFGSVANKSCPFSYTVTEADALAGVITNIATLTATDEAGNRLSASAAVTVPASVAGFGVITEMTITKAETSTPANGSYYTEGEVINYEIVICNDGETEFGECIIYDSQVAGNISNVEHLYVSETRSFPYSHTVTAADVAAGCVYNTAWVEYVNGDAIETKMSNTVVSDTDGVAETFASNGTGTISTPVLLSGGIYTPCSHELLAKGDNGEESLTHYCALHIDTQETIAKLMSLASTENDKLSVWTQARKLWQDEIDEMYVSLLDASDSVAKVNVMNDRIYFYAAMGCHEELLNSLYSDDPVQVASLIAESFMNKSVSMCYELHTAANDRIDAFAHVRTFDFDLPCGEDCAQNAVASEDGDVRVAEQLCAHHASVLQIRNRLLSEKESTAEAWATVGQLWKNEVSTSYIELYAKLGELALTASETFDNSVKAHEKVLDALYDRPEVVKEVLAQMMMDRAMELCGIK